MKQELFQEIHAFSLWGEHADHFEYLASGKDGDVYTCNNYAIKIFKADGKSRDDGKKLQLLENSIYYPKVHVYTNEYMVSDLIKGETFYNLTGHDEYLREKYVSEIQQAVIDAHQAGLSAFDLHNHNIILTNEGEVRIVDVGRFGNEHEMMHLGFFGSWFSSSRRRKHKRNHHHHSSSNKHHRRKHSKSHSISRFFHSSSRSYSSS